MPAKKKAEAPAVEEKPEKKAVVKPVFEFDKPKVVEITNDDAVAKKAYDKMRAKIGGNFPAWDDLKPELRKTYQDAATHCQETKAPRTTFEKTVLEIVKNG